MRPAVLLVSIASSVVFASAPTSQQAAAFEAKMNGVIARGEARPSGVSTEFAEDEVNAYLQLRLVEKFPSGVTDPSVALLGQGRLSARAVVDLDGIRKKSSGGWFDPAAYLTGKLPIGASGVLKTANGRGQVLIEATDIGGVPIPKALLQEIVSYYTRSADMPAGVDLDAPFDLPVGIQRIDVVSDKATVVQ